MRSLTTILCFASLTLVVQCDMVKRLQEQAGDGGAPATTVSTTAKAPEEPACQSIPCPPVGIAACDDYIAQSTACFKKGDPTIIAVRLKLLAGIRNIWAEGAKGEREAIETSCKQQLAEATKTGTFVCEH
jgi:hypothetical protein